MVVSPFAMPEESASRHFHPGDSLGSYTLLSPLARGGMGTVWAAALRSTRGFTRIVAIKTILSDLAEDPEYARALRDEAQLAASITHPNLCDVTEFGQAAGFPYLVMEWVDGASLAELLTFEPSGSSWDRLEPFVATRIVADACGGLHALHEAKDPTGVPLGAIHRDVSPQNLMITRHGQVKVSDLGVAKARGQWRARTRSGELRGKLGFLSPEQLGKGPLDRRADVHALGCVLYLCLSGELPYPPVTDAFDLVLTGAHRPLDRARPELCPELVAIVSKALHPKPEQRYQSAHALREALEGWRARKHIDHDRSLIAECLRARQGALVQERHRRIWSAYERFAAGPEMSLAGP